MPTDIEQKIYRLGIDDSDYIRGVDSMSTSTKKLTDAQTKSNAKLAELEKLQKSYAASLATTTAILKANEKETIELTKQLNALKDSEKGTSAEATRLKAELRGLSVNTKEFKSEAVELKKNLDLTTSQLKSHTKEIQAAEKASGNFAGGITKVYSGLRTVANLIPGIGIGGLVALISGPVINAFSEWYESITKTNDALRVTGLIQKDFDEISKETNKDAGKQIADLKILYEATQNVALSTETRTKAAKELQALYPEIFKNFTTENILLGDAKAAYDKLTTAIYANARAAAGKKKLEDLGGAALDLETSIQNAENEFDRANLKFNLEIKKSVKEGADQMKDQSNQFITLTREGITKVRDEKLKGFKQDLLDNKAQQNAIVRLVGAENLVENIIDTTKVKKAAKDKNAKKVQEINDDFEARKAAILLAIAKLAETEFQTEVNIRKEYAAKLKKAIIDINNDKGLKPGEREELISLTTTLNTNELTKALADFHKKQSDATKKLNEELNNLKEKNTQDQLNLLQNEFDRRAKLIDFNEQKELDTAKENTQKRLAALDLQRLLIGEQAYQDAKNNIISAGELQALNIIQKFANQRKDLSADIFKSLLDAYSSAIRNADLVRNEDETKALQEAQAKFLRQESTFKEFQKEITDIQKRFNKERLDNDLQTEINQLAELDRRIAATIDKTSQEYKDLLKLRDDYRKKIAADEKQQVTSTEDPNKPPDPRLANLLKFVSASKELADSVVQFWQAANDAESKALDRSISLQEKRVDAAQKIALRGNAQYLKAEEDRLKELNIKRENAARKQLGIDAALQASQILVGITGAIAKIATPGIGIAETIGAIAIIVGALATGYGLVKSLQGNQPKLFRGTKDTGLGGREDGQGGFTATLHPNEAVIPADRNKAYHPAVAAIYDKTIPAESLNNFVRTYHKIKGVPQPNYSRIKDAAELHINSDGRMSVLLSENNKKLDEHIDLQKQTLRAMKSMSVSASVDKNGVAIMVNEYISQMKIDKRV